jgi:Brp/Blh family beta-carotene 15,15'-monooxygenase
MMKQPTFLFIALLLLSFPFLSGGLELSMENQFMVSMFLVFTIGIAHGSVDNILYLKKTTVKPLSFYLIYLLLVGSYALLWFVFPLFAITSFLLISAYHFGQSQLIDCFKNSTLMHKFLYAVWGISLLSALLNIKQGEIVAIFSSYEDLRIFETLLGSEYIHYLHIASTITVVALLLYFTASRQFSNERMFFEFFILILINFSFAAFPVLPGFTLYFVFLHSLNSLQDEFKFLKNRDQLQIWSFIKKLLPNTIISIAATLVIFASIYFDYIDFSYGFVILVLISSITFPHVFVMEKFYSPDL